MFGIVLSQSALLQKHNKQLFLQYMEGKTGTTIRKGASGRYAQDQEVSTSAPPLNAHDINIERTRRSGGALVESFAS